MLNITDRDPMLQIRDIEKQWKFNFLNSNFVIDIKGVKYFNKNFAKNLFYGIVNENDIRVNVSNPIISHYYPALEGYRFIDKNGKQKSLIGCLSEIEDNDLNKNILNFIDLLKHIGIVMSTNKIFYSLEIEEHYNNKEKIFATTIINSTYWILEQFSNPKKQDYIDINDPFEDTLGDLLTLSSIQAGFFEDIRLYKYNGYRKLAYKLHGRYYSRLACKYYTKSIQYDDDFFKKEVEQTRINIAFSYAHFKLAAKYIDEYMNQYAESEYSTSSFNLSDLYYMASFSYTKIGRTADAINLYNKIENEKFVIDVKVEQLFQEERFADINKLYPYFESPYMHYSLYHKLRCEIIWMQDEFIKDISDLYKNYYLKINCVEELGKNVSFPESIVAGLYVAFKHGDIEFIKEFKQYIHLNIDKFLEYKIPLQNIFFPDTAELSSFLKLLGIDFVD